MITLFQKTPSSGVGFFSSTSYMYMYIYAHNKTYKFKCAVEVINL